MEWVREERERQGLSQRELARRARIAYKTLQLLESGRHDPRWSTLVKIADAIGVDRAAMERRVAGAPGEAPRSLAAVSARLLRDGEDSWKGWLLEFVDDFRLRPRASLVSRAPEPALSHRLQALLASSVEYLCSEKGVPVPWWCAGVPPLDEPWFVAGVESLKAAALVESPAQFRQRNIFVLGNFLSRA